MAEQEQLHVLHVFDHSIPLHSGYAFRSLAILREQHRLHIHTRQLTGPKHYLTTPEQETVDHLLFHRTSPGLFGAVPVLQQWDVIRQLSKKIEQLVKQQRPDIIHAHSPALNALAAASVARKYNIPLVYEMRASWEDAAVSHGSCKEGDLRYRLSQWLEKKALRSADYVVTICEGLANRVRSWGIPANNITIVANAVDTSQFPVPAAKPEQLLQQWQLHGKTVLGFLGSFYRYEGLHLLLDALPSLIKDFPDLRLLLAGGGPQEEALKQQCHQLGLDNYVLFTGRIPHKQISDYYALVDIFVYPREAIPLTEIVTPLKPLEAMAQQGLVVASDIGGHRELIKHNETGILFTPDNPQALATVLHQLLTQQHDWPRLKLNGQRFVEQERSWQHTVASILPVYRQLSGKTLPEPANADGKAA